MKQVAWFERKFSFTTENIMPSVIERLEGTPLRIRHKLAVVGPTILTLKPDDKWSVLEHLGHLADLEPLWQGRLMDILSGQEILREADLTNRATTEANHNEQPVAALIAAFETLRNATVEALLKINEEDVFRSALHPRLKTPMRTQDLFIFVAEHDDHHLAKMTEIIGAQQGRPTQSHA